MHLLLSVNVSEMISVFQPILHDHVSTVCIVQKCELGSSRWCWLIFAV